MQKILKVIFRVLGGLVLVVVAFAVYLWIISPGKTEPFTGPTGEAIEGSIATIEKIHLGGVDQYLIIRGLDTRKPVMLFLHGGPGSPEYAFMKAFNPYLEHDFVMVYWEQRGAGKSYSKNIGPETMTLEQMISDTRALSEYLATRFGKDKIYLLGHSWGSLLGVMTAWRHPELFHAYFGVGQAADQYRGEQISYEWVKEQAHVFDNRKAIRTFEQMSFPDPQSDVATWQNYLMIQRKYVMLFGGGVTRDIRGMGPLVKILLATGEYTFGDKIKFMQGNMFSLEHLWPAVVHTNLISSIDSLQVPVYIFQGVYDFQTPHKIAREFFNQVKAPQKEFFTFENAAHSPLFEDAERFNSLISRIVEERDGVALAP